MPFVVGRACQCLYALEAWCRAGHSGRGVSWHVSEDGIEPAAILQEMWRPFDDQSPSAGIGRCLCKYITCVEVYPGRAHQLRQNCLAHAGRSEEHTSELQSLRHLVCRLL